MTNLAQNHGHADQGCEKPQNGRPGTVWPKVDGRQPSRRQKKNPIFHFAISFYNYQTIYIKIYIKMCVFFFKKINSTDIHLKI